MKKHFLFISCEEAQHICDKAQYGEATFWERFKLSIRLTYCNMTKSYSKRNSTLTKTIDESNVKCLKAEERQKLQDKFNQELTKHQ
ncbi:MAG: hypothetical protein CMC76_00040 [Flavobacteriaceae bacterium]|uniref:hypothetical protein n=1 Tax=Winogradskyella sp. SYSU M77433 TaxID=3042722 RepID=UPI000C419597|nr:hypothetical protein [Winogradskyella sp. SYSU M77433]MAX69483.1 hypothetical protein [Flavobacteriaceae bacterium]MDH7914569.1 hypothetical protein [Winogradskyella sp. SYSU M77433]|tara:strand:+ start:453 stop:710 length:258 start_codon:yes stop_codon:yes gene_type:complete